MNFLEAVKYMKEGKKVRRKNWSKDNYWCLRNTPKWHLMSGNNEIIDDWEIYEEKKTLSSEIYNSEEQYLRQGGKSDELIVLSIVKFRQKVKEFIESLPIIVMNPNDINKVDIQKYHLKEIAKEIFGERLI